MTRSCIYEGAIRHRRRDPRREFRHQLALMYIDLEELPALLDGRLASPRPGLVRFRRRDYLGERSAPLDEAVREAVAAQTGAQPTGPIRVLTQLRSFGHCFNPVSFYYCFDPGGERLSAVLTEVTNTPWGERHAYVMSSDGEPDGIVRAQFEKAMHVSPFIGMDHRYDVWASTPGDTLTVQIDSVRRGCTAFDATLSLRRHQLTRASVRRLARRYPLASVRVLGLIYGHAVALKLAGAPVHPHPTRARA